jgi:hypothetical protein
MILYQQKLIFIHIPKCAGSSIEKAFNYIDDYENYSPEVFGPDHRPIRALEQGDFSFNRISSWENFTETRRRLRDVKKQKPNPMKNLQVTAEQYQSFYKFTFVRNPWARAYSMYKHIMREEHKQRRYKMHKLPDTSFKTFLQHYAGKKDIQPQMYWLKNFAGENAMDFVGRFENLNDDFAKVCQDLNIEPLALPHVYKGSGDDYRQHFDTAMVDLLADVYSEEIELFDYRFE